MTEREELIKQLSKDFYETDTHFDYESVADWIMADRRRIVQPLIDLNKVRELIFGRMFGKTAISRAINETIRLSGVAEERK